VTLSRSTLKVIGPSLLSWDKNARILAIDVVD